MVAEVHAATLPGYRHCPLGEVTEWLKVRDWKSRGR